MTGIAGKTPSARRWWILPTLALLITAGAPLATASNASDVHGAEMRAAASEDPMVTDTRERIDRFIKLWNEKKLDELVAGHYIEDALMLPPNHEPIRGRPAILAYFKSLRDVVGEAEETYDVMRTTPSGNTVSVAALYVFGTLRITAHELYVRQPDGSMRNAVDMFGYRDPMA